MMEQKSVAWPRALSPFLPSKWDWFLNSKHRHVEVQLQPKDPRQRRCNPDSFQSTLCQSLLRQMLDWGSLPSAEMDHVIRCIPAPRIKTGTRLSGTALQILWKKAQILASWRTRWNIVAGWTSMTKQTSHVNLLLSGWARIHPQRFMVTKSCKECVSLDASLLTNSSVQSSLPNLNYQ